MGRRTTCNVVKTCPICEQEFTNPNPKTVYCTPFCALQAKHRDAAEVKRLRSGLHEPIEWGNVQPMGYAPGWCGW